MELTASRCIAPGCANPYLAWHPIAPDEAVPLCLAHAKQAVDTAAPADRLRSLAQAASRERAWPIWRQRHLLVRMAGDFYYETPILLRLGSMTCIGVSRGEEANLQLTLRMPTASGQPRAVITDNVWQAPPDGAEVTCPSSGRVLDIAYPNGDHFRADFTDVHNAGVLQMRFGTVARWAYRVEFPVTLAEISLAVANTDIELGPDRTGMGGPSTVDCFTSHRPVAIDIPLTSDQVATLFPAEPAEPAD